MIKSKYFFGVMLVLWTVITVILATGCKTAQAQLTDNTPQVVEEEPQYTKEMLYKLMATCDAMMGHATQMREGAIGLGYGPDNYVVQLAEREMEEAVREKTMLQEELDKILAEEAKWARRMNEYPAATTVWLYLKELGYNDYVCAGILGNMMSEVGGNTLKLKIDLIDHSGYYYGICQWSKGGYPRVWYTDLDTQLNFLRDTIEYELNTYGYMYQKGMKYSQFLNLTDSRQAALAFAKAYERCSSKSYSARQNNAEKAYNYFVG